MDRVIEEVKPKVELQSKIQYNLPFQLKLEVGSYYTGNAFSSRTEEILIGSDVEPIQIGSIEREEHYVNFYLITQGNMPYVVRYEVTTPPYHTNQSNWYDKDYEVFDCPIHKGSLEIKN